MSIKYFCIRYQTFISTIEECEKCGLKNVKNIICKKIPKNVLKNVVDILESYKFTNKK